MSEIVTIEERLRRFAGAPDDADWQDVLRRADLTTARRDTPRTRSRWPRRRLVAAIVVAVLALAGTAVSIAGRSLFGFSNHGTRVHPGPDIRRMLSEVDFKLAGLPYNSQSPNTFRRLALRQGIGIYIARTKEGNHRCYYVGSRASIPHLPPHKLYLNGLGCDPYAGQHQLPPGYHEVWGGKDWAIRAWERKHPFPSPARPVLDLSAGGDRAGFLWLQPVGLAADGVRSIQLLAQSDCHPFLTVPVINNVYIDANPPQIAVAFIVARDASGKIIWRSTPINGGPFSHRRTPTDPKVPRNCGFR